MTTEEIVKNWERDGFVVLEGFFSEERTEGIKACLDRAWKNRPKSVTVDVVDLHRRCHMNQVAPADRKRFRIKVNDLYLNEAEVRELALDREIVPVLTRLLGEKPVLCNSLNLERGSEQNGHVDSIYMTPRTPGKLIATWIALEDSEPDAGQLFYYPGSHKIEPYLFSNGSRHSIPEEMNQWEAWRDREIEKLGLKKEFFSAKRGDLLIWHSELIHGGSQIKNKEKTRNSIVFHYWAEPDSIASGHRLEELNGAYWYKRPPQPVPTLGSKVKDRLRSLKRRWASANA